MAITAEVSDDIGEIIEETVIEVNGQKKKKKKKKKKNGQEEIEIVAMAGGTKSANGGLAWTNEYWDSIGPEMIIRKSDNAILTPLGRGDGVIPANFTDNLFKWGALDPDTFLRQQKVTEPNVTNVVNNNNYNPITLHYDALVNVEGSVDSTVMPDLKDILQQSYEYTSKQFKREAKKIGIF
jgi:hypothetical protein